MSPHVTHPHPAPHQLMYRIVQLVVVVVVMLVTGGQGQCGDTPPGTHTGTTAHMREIFIGRCYEYQQIISPRDQLKNCTELYELFVSSFAYIAPCDVTAQHYHDYVKRAMDGEPSYVDKTMLWSGGLHQLSSEYSAKRRRVVTIAYTMMGYMLNEIEWCGLATNDTNTSDGINYEACPCYTECDEASDYGRAFWKQASIKFATIAEGYVRALLNANAAFSTTSLFYIAELPNLDATKVTQLDLILASRPDQEVVETCDSENIRHIITTAEGRGLNVTCVQDANDIQHLLCVDWPENQYCIGTLDGTSSAATSSTSITYTLHTSICLLFFLLYMHNAVVF